MTTPLGTFGAPPDTVAWVALMAAVLTLSAGFLFRDQLRRVPNNTIVAGLALGAALLSIGYVAYYLRGGPRIIDATSYWLEARALATGQLALDVPDPGAAFRGRFLVPTPDGRLSVIFPPGYPAALALGFVAGVPMLVGPAIAAALVVATHWLARQIFDREVALVAATLSMFCAALRYHTADTMSHGWAALLLTLTLASAMRGTRGWALVSGLALGWLVATRPVTGVVVAFIAAWLALRHAEGRRLRLLLFAGATIPGVLLLVAHQSAATGSITGSSQLLYYSLADGPPGCFKWGVGAGIGCLHEHGDFVRSHLPDGYGPKELVLTTVRRLRYHWLDIANAEPLALLVPFAAVATWRVARARALSLVAIGVVVAYAPFYFDGNYPGGGARMLADALPVEHVLLAWAIHRFSLARYLIPASLVGFALHAAYDHLDLQAREGGRPMFEPHVLADAGVRSGIVLVDTDHGFNLGFDPGAGLVVARYSGDAHAALLWNGLGRPEVHRYLYDFDGRPPRVEAYEPPDIAGLEALRFEAEALWPPLSVSGGWVHPAFVATRCESNGRGLRLRASRGSAVEVWVDIHAPSPGMYVVEAVWLPAEQSEPYQAEVTAVTASGHGPPIPDPRARQSGASSSAIPGGQTTEMDACRVWASAPIALEGQVSVRLDSKGENAVLDALRVVPAAQRPE